MNVIEDLRGLLRLRLIRLLAYTLLMSLVGGTCLHFRYSVLDPDIWWHLKVGEWILQHWAVPHNGIYSYTAASRPWVAYSWGYEVLLSKSYSIFGFMGIAWFGVALTMAVAVATFWALHRVCSKFWTAWILSLISLAAFLFSIMPRPLFFSMVLYAVLLTLLLEAQRKNQVRLLYGLPLIFVLWANLHIQFIYGLFVVGLFVGFHVLKQIAKSRGLVLGLSFTPTLPARPLLMILGACALASCLGPYSYRLFAVVFEYSGAKVTYSTILELQALSFSSWEQYLEALLAIGGFYAVGWKKKFDPFAFALMCFAAVSGFRTWRDAWFLCMTAAILIAEATANEPSPLIQERAATAGKRLLEYASVTGAVVVLLLLLARNLNFVPRELDRAISVVYPVDAVNYLRKHPIPGPVFNSFLWGGFLMWYQPQYPVAIDGRNDLYGEELDARNFRTESGDPSYVQDPWLNSAGFVLLTRVSPLTNSLAMDRRFTVVYHDDVAVVFVPRNPPPPALPLPTQ